MQRASGDWLHECYVFARDADDKTGSAADFLFNRGIDNYVLTDLAESYENGNGIDLQSVAIMKIVWEHQIYVASIQQRTAYSRYSRVEESAFDGLRDCIVKVSVALQDQNVNKELPALVVFENAEGLQIEDLWGCVSLSQAIRNVIGQFFSTSSLKIQQSIRRAIDRELDFTFFRLLRMRHIDLRFDSNNHVRIGQAQTSRSAGTSNDISFQFNRPEIWSRSAVVAKVVLKWRIVGFKKFLDVWMKLPERRVGWTSSPLHSVDYKPWFWENGIFDFSNVRLFWFGWLIIAKRSGGWNPELNGSYFIWFFHPERSFGAFEPTHHRAWRQKLSKALRESF